MNILELQGVSKRFGEKGTIFGFVGENGAGKTTTMKMILGLEKLSEGQILINGESVHFGKTPTNRFTGYLPDVPEFYSFMTAEEYLVFCGEITGMNRATLFDKVKEMLDLVGLKTEKRRIQGFSRGMKQRLGIAQALLNDPELLICDEPTSALDPGGRNDFLELLASLKGKVTILFSTHILSDVERICDSVGILDEGKLKVSSSLQQLKADYAKNKIELGFSSVPNASLIRSLSELETINKVEQEAHTLILSYSKDYSFVMKTIFELLDTSEQVPISIKKIEPTLEAIFLEVLA